jgi:DNA-binding MarR family transcriptional regulator
MTENYIRLMRDTEQLEEIFFTADTERDLNRTEQLLLHIVRMNTLARKRIISTQLANKIHVTRSAISQTVDRMSEKGYICRVAAEDDKKIAYIELSEKEKQKLQKETLEQAALYEKIEKEMGKENAAQLLCLLEKFVATANNIKKE